MDRCDRTREDLFHKFLCKLDMDQNGNGEAAENQEA